MIGRALGEIDRQLMMPLARLFGHGAMRCGPLFGGATHVKSLVRLHLDALLVHLSHGETARKK